MKATLLKDVKVLELAGLAPAPFCGMILAEFGASVIRVDKADKTQGTMDALGQGKRSIALNLKTKEGSQILRQLSNHSDVIIDPFRRGVMEKLKLGPADLMETNKRLIYARLTGFGQTGPYADMAGHDINFVAVSGLLSLFGRYNQKPTPPVNLAADFGGGGLMCAFGILLALYERTKSNLGQVIDASMVEGTAYLGSWMYRTQNIGMWANPRGKNMLDSGMHFYDTYETKDNKYMAVGSVEPQFYKVLLNKLGLSSDEVPQFDNFEDNSAKLEEIFKKKTQAEWCEIFDGTDACVTPVLSMQEAALHKHNKERGTFSTSKDNFVVPNPAPRLSRTPGVSMANLTHPQPGEHTTEILSELKFEHADIERLKSEGVVYQAHTRANL